MPLPTVCSNFFSETKITDWLQLVSVPVTIYIAYLSLKNERKNSLNSILITELQNWLKSLDELTENFDQFYSNPPDEALRVSILTQIKILSRNLYSLLELFDDVPDDIKNAWLDYRIFLTGNDFEDRRRTGSNDIIKVHLEKLSRKLHTQASKNLKKLS